MSSSDITGSCVCGAITVTLKGGYKDAKGIVCHCTSCKKRGGSLESISVPVPKEDTVITGKTVVYVPPTTTSGKRGERHFCGTCGSHIVGYSDSMPDSAYVKMALFDVQPPLALDVWLEDAYDFEKPIAAAPQGAFFHNERKSTQAAST